MTENEAIEELKRCLDLPYGNDIKGDTAEVAISALEEIQQYRALGTVEEIEPYIRLAEKLNICDLVRENARVNNELKFMEIKLREAMEKQKAKKPLGGVDIDGNEYAICRECSAILTDGEWFAKYCPDCGQAIDWSEEE